MKKIEEGKVRLYYVTQAVWGADRPKRLYFETKAEANEYREKHEYVNKVGYTDFEPSVAKQLLQDTLFDMIDVWA